VHLNLALREPLVPTDDGIGFDHDLGLERERVMVTAPAGASHVDLAAALDNVRNAVVVVGDNAGDPIPIARWCEQVGWPLIAEPHSNARLGTSAIRAADAVLRDSDFTATYAPDLVVVVGRVGLSRPLLDWLRETPHLVISPDGGNWDVTRTARAIVRCETSCFDELDPATYRAEADWSAGWQKRAERAAAAIDALLDAEAGLTEPRVARDIARALPVGGSLVVASSMPIRDLDLVMEPRDDITVYANRGVSGIDGFVSTALGIALARPEPPTVALCGDLSLLHDSNGFLVGSGPRPDVTFVVINNDGGGIFSLLPQASAVPDAAFEQLFGTPHGARLDALAAAYGIDYRRATTSAELTEALSAPDGIRIVEVKTDRAENVTLHARLRAVTAGS
jgi:2-succinyl-5-enolpyruvyl-6-hydroxy-3-cyclohexene-1-carboxylate synthase